MDVLKMNCFVKGNRRRVYYGGAETKGCSRCGGMSTANFYHQILKKSLNITLSRTLLAGGSLVYVMLQREGMSLHDALANATTVLSRP